MERVPTLAGEKYQPELFSFDPFFAEERLSMGQILARAQQQVEALSIMSEEESSDIPVWKIAVAVAVSATVGLAVRRYYVKRKSEGKQTNSDEQPKTDTPTEAPNETAKETPKEIPTASETPTQNETPTEAPKEAPEMAPEETPKEAPKEIPETATQNETPTETATETATDTAAETPAEAASESDGQDKVDPKPTDTGS